MAILNNNRRVVDGILNTYCQENSYRARALFTALQLFLMETLVTSERIGQSNKNN